MRLRTPRPSIAVTLLAALLLALLPVASAGPEPVGEAGDIAIERFGGANRVETAIQVSQAAFETATTVVLARADDLEVAQIGAVSWSV